MTSSPRRPFGFRWVICALLFVATAVNYADRGFFGNLAPELRAVIGWSPGEYWYMQGAFFAAYALSYLVAGRLMDRIGLRWGYPLAVAFWSVALMSHAAMSSVAGFFCARILLGLGEGGSFPAAVKTTAEWFPRAERGLAGGLFNAGCNVGALVVPLGLAALMPLFNRIQLHGHILGWRGAFLITGLFNVGWIAAWFRWYGPPAGHPRVSPDELRWIRRDPPEAETPLGWGAVIGRRPSLALALAKFLTDCMSWFYLVGSPVFLADRFGLTLEGRGLPLAAIYLFASVGSVAGGWLSGYLLQRGCELSRARKLTLLICAVAVVPVAYAAYTPSYWTAVALIGLAYSAHQAWAATMWIMIPDLFPARASGSVAGFTGMAGAIGGIVLFVIFGAMRSGAAVGDYRLFFLSAACAYLVALGVLHLMLPAHRYRVTV